MDLYNYCQKLYQFSQTQTECIKEGEYDRLLEILKEKQKIIDKADKIDIDKYIETQDQPEQALTQLKKLMTDMKELEDKNQKLIEQDKNKLSARMLDFSKKQKSREGYNQSSGYEAKFIDKRN